MGAASHEPVVLNAVADGPLHVVRRCVDIADLLATAASRQADAALVSADLPGLDAEMVERIESDGVVVVGIVASSPSPAEAHLRALGIANVAFADDLVTLVELVVAVISDRKSTARVPSPTGRAEPDADPAPYAGSVIAVWGPTGAPGRSTVAMGVAAALAGRGRTTLLIDADVYGGSTAIQLGVLDEISGLLAAARAANTGVLTAETLIGHARSVAPRLHVLTGLPRADRWTEVKAVLMGRIVQVARQTADYVVVDCGFSVERDEEIMYDTAAPRRNGATVEVLERADVVLLVGAADPIGLSRLIRAGHDLGSMRLDARSRIVVNRARASLGWSREEMTATLVRTLGPGPVSYLPDDPQTVDRCLVQGATVYECAADSRLATAVDDLVGDLVGSSDDGEDRPPSPGRPSDPNRRRRARAVRKRRAARAR